MDLSAEFCSIEFVASDDGVAIRVLGEMDLASSSLLDAALAGVDGHGTVEVDLSQLTFCDAAGLRVLALARERFGTRLCVTGATPMLRRLAGIVDMGWLATDGAAPARRYGDSAS